MPGVEQKTMPVMFTVLSGWNISRDERQRRRRCYSQACSQPIQACFTELSLVWIDVISKAKAWAKVTTSARVKALTKLHFSYWNAKNGTVTWKRHFGGANRGGHDYDQLLRVTTSRRWQHHACQEHWKRKTWDIKSAFVQHPWHGGQLAPHQLSQIDKSSVLLPVMKLFLPLPFDHVHIFFDAISAKKIHQWSPGGPSIKHFLSCLIKKKYIFKYM